MSCRSLADSQANFDRGTNISHFGNGLIGLPTATPSMPSPASDHAPKPTATGQMIVLTSSAPRLVKQADKLTVTHHYWRNSRRPAAPLRNAAIKFMTVSPQLSHPTLTTQWHKSSRWRQTWASGTTTPSSQSNSQQLTPAL